VFQRLIGVGGEGVSTTYVTGCRLCLFASKINGSIWACWKVFKCRFLAIFASRGSPFHPVSVVSPLNAAQFTLDLAGTLIGKLLPTFSSAFNRVFVLVSNLPAGLKQPKRTNPRHFRTQGHR